MILHFQVQCNFLTGIFHIRCRLVRHEILCKCFFLKGFEPCEIRLVVAEHAGHQFNIRTVFICQVTVPGLAEVAAAPGPLLLAGTHMMVRHMQNACALPVIISADKIIIGVRAHITGRYRYIFIPGDIHTGAIIMLVIYTGRNREPADRTLAMIEHRCDIRRKNGLCKVIYCNCGICPPQKRLWKRRTVIELTSYFDICPSRIQCETDLALRAIHLVNFTALCRTAAVTVLTDLIIRRCKRRRTMVLRPVKLDSPADPWTRQTDQCRLYHFIVIYKVIMTCLIKGALNPSSQFRQNHDLQIFIFQIYCGVRFIYLCITDFFHHGIRIYFARTALIYSFFNKNRIFLRLTDFIGGNAYTFRPYFCLAHLLSLRLIPLTVLPYPIYFSFSQKALHAFAVSFIFPAVAFSFQIRYNFSNCIAYGGISFEILRKVYFRKIRLLYLYAKSHC